MLVYIYVFLVSAMQSRTDRPYKSISESRFLEQNERRGLDPHHSSCVIRPGVCARRLHQEVHQVRRPNHYSLGWSEKHNSQKMQKMQKLWVDSEPRHNTDFRTISKS